MALLQTFDVIIKTSVKNIRGKKLQNNFSYSHNYMHTCVHKEKTEMT